MSVTAIPVKTTLSVKMLAGMDGDKPVYVSRNLSNVKANATDANVHAIGVGLATLMTPVLEAVRRLNEFELEQD